MLGLVIACMLRLSDHRAGKCTTIIQTIPRLTHPELLAAFTTFCMRMPRAIAIAETATNILFPACGFVLCTGIDFLVLCYCTARCQYPAPTIRPLFKCGLYLQLAQLGEVQQVFVKQVLAQHGKPCRALDSASHRLRYLKVSWAYVHAFGQTQDWDLNAQLAAGSLW